MATMPNDPQAVSPLDNVIWTALTTKQRAFSVGDALARRYPADIGPFVAMADVSPASFASLHGLLTPGEIVLLGRLEDVYPPDNLQVVRRESVVQMVATQLDAPRADADLIELGENDVGEMRALNELTKPGPFAARTHQLGRYFGIRNKGTLVAMGGERFRLDGYTEISGVCCHPDHRGRGHARDLVLKVAAGIFARGDVPFLHCFAENAPAIALYRKLGFEVRQTVRANLIQRAG